MQYVVKLRFFALRIMFFFWFAEVMRFFCNFSGLYPSDCQDIRDTQGDCSGVYTIYLSRHEHEDKQPVDVFCHIEQYTTWTVSTATLCPKTAYHLLFNLYYIISKRLDIARQSKWLIYRD